MCHFYLFSSFHMILLEFDISYYPYERAIDLFMRLELTQSSFPDKHIVSGDRKGYFSSILLWLRTLV